MTDLMPAPAPVSAHTQPVDREGTTMLLHEALARSRQQEAEQAAREFALARSITAGRRWAVLARFAARRAERARASVRAR
ncbi:MAG: hypothetical protein H0V92_01495 [Pseudonocardiales bacterium]|nr:hypothetical protein [Pseudonocardiales bacterium]